MPGIMKLFFFGNKIIERRGGDHGGPEQIIAKVGGAANFHFLGASHFVCVLNPPSQPPPLARPKTSQSL